jgi:hypothetical protein
MKTNNAKELIIEYDEESLLSISPNDASEYLPNDDVIKRRKNEIDGTIEAITLKNSYL